MKTLMIPLIASILLSVPAAGQAHLNVQAVATIPGGFLYTFTVTGPPASFFDVYYVVGNIFTNPNLPIGLLYSAQTDPGGVSIVQIPAQFNVNVTVPQAQFAAVFTGSFVVTEIVSLSLVAAPPPPPPACVTWGTISYNPATCVVTARVKLCPGDTFELKLNGVTVLSASAPPNEATLAAGGICLGAGDTLTGTLNGAPWLGPITGP